MNTRPSRRIWLRSAGAGLLALPWLDSARAAPPSYPQRLLLVYTPNGTVPNEWFPRSFTDETNFELGRILAPLGEHRERLTIVEGVDGHVALDPENNGGPHQRGIGALFTGRMLGTGSFRDGCGATAGFPTGPSLDQVVAGLIGAETPFSSLEFGVRAFDDDVQGRISYRAAGMPLPPTNDPRAVYERLFQPEAPLDPRDPNGRARSVLDSVHEQFAALQKRVGADDRKKLDAHAEMLRDLERRLGIGSGGPRCVAPSMPPPLDPASEDDMPLVSRAHLDLIATAFACDLTRVASIQYSTGFNKIRYPWLGSLAEGHTLSHAGDGNTEAWDEFRGRLEWHSSELAYFLDRLANTPEGDGTILDRTLIVWASEVQRGNSHSLRSLPYLLLGTAGGRVRGGRYLRYDHASNGDLLLTLARAFGYEDDTFGDPRFSDGVLSGLLV